MNALLRMLAAAALSAASLAAADLTGIWMGEAPGRNGEKQDLAFQFQAKNRVVNGIMFGDEFDLSVENLKIEGDHVSFSVTSVNYYDARRTKSVFTGTLTDATLELTREQSGPRGAAAAAAKQPEAKQAITLKRIV